jgi:MbtH protein
LVAWQVGIELALHGNEWESPGAGEYNMEFAGREEDFMGHRTLESNPTYVVVQKSENQYSIWSAVCLIPLGWEATSKAGSLDDCLAYLSEMWAVLPPSECNPTQFLD